jgi:hypothetical protein
MKQSDLLDSAIQAIKAEGRGDAELSGAAKRVAERLGLDAAKVESVDWGSSPIRNCGDVKELMRPYKEGLLSPSRLLLVEAHLKDCGACLREFRSGDGGAALDWSAPSWSERRASRTFPWQVPAFRWALVPTLALLLAGVFLYRAYWQVPPGVQAEVRSIDGTAYSISDSGERRLAPGDTLGEGEHLRTSGGAHAVLGLSDGSTIEVNERSVLGVGARGHNMTLSLDNGAVIVQAAKRNSGYLYVKTPDCRVAVTGTVFSVNSGIKGSRVAVLQGSVQVRHAGMNTAIHAGDQLATYDNGNSAPARLQIADQISWSQDRAKYLALTAQFATLEQRIGALPFPQARYTSDLLTRVPANTLMYVSIPNLGDFLSEANAIFHDQLTQSAALQQWWGRGKAGNTADLDAVVDRLRAISQYLGDEVVIVGLKQNDLLQTGQNHADFAVIADVEKSGLGDLLRSRFSSSTTGPDLVVLDEQSLGAANSSLQGQRKEYALVREHEAVFSDSIATLKQVDAQLNAGASGFAAGEFGQQITAAYSRGAGVIVAADLHQMLEQKAVSGNAAMDKSGLDDVKYLIAEHRESNGVTDNHLNLQFSGARQRVASWLATPGPMGSLDFVTPNAAFATAFLTKDPKAIADDIMKMTARGEGTEDDTTDAQAQLHASLRDDLAASLGGEFLVALDGPVLPTPSWKAVIEVRDAAQLEQTLERAAEEVRDQTQHKGNHNIVIESAVDNGQKIYSIHDLTSGEVVASYLFADGYMIVGANRALLFAALQAHASGDSLARSEAFKQMLPKDDNDNYSAVAYQNLSPVLTPLLSQVSGESAAAIQKLAADSKPTAICAWGRDTRIEAASNSRLLGFDFLTLGSFVTHSGDSNPSHVRNKLSSGSVRD